MKITSAMKAKPLKAQREKQVLMGLVDLYIQTGKPIGSQTLQENGFETYSSATIRNYFVKLEEEGLLAQGHSSAGRIPTSLAFKLYIEEACSDFALDPKEKKWIKSKLIKDTKEVIAYLQEACDLFSELAGCASFLSTLRFDQDFVSDIRLVQLDNHRLLSVLITDFGLVHTEIMRVDAKLSHFSVKRLESFFKFKMTGLDRPELSDDEEIMAKKLYNEVLMRHLVNHVHFTHSDVYKTGFSKLLGHSDFAEITQLSSTMALFENESSLLTILSDAQRTSQLIRYIGDDLNHFIKTKEPIASVLAIPYSIHQNTAGALGILIPLRSDYKRLIALLNLFQECVSETLTKSIYKHKISYRKPSITPEMINESPYEALKLPFIDIHTKETS
jgi:heat-inducible transcriptional repressor